MADPETFPMGAYETADVSRRIFNERKRYVETVLQQGVPVVDADVNDFTESIWTQVRRLTQRSVGNGALENADNTAGVAFQIAQRVVASVLVPNDFVIRGGADPDFGPEIFFAQGVQASLFENDAYRLGRETAPQVTGVVPLTLFDATANYAPNALVGGMLIPNIANPGAVVPIVGNTANSITVASANLQLMTADGRRYRIALTTPVADRSDLVVLNLWLEETNGDEDPTLRHVIDGQSVVAMMRFRVEEIVQVFEGVSDPSSIPSGYTDANGNRHVLVPIARLNRRAGVSTISDAMIEDLRRRIVPLDTINNRFLRISPPPESVDGVSGTMLGHVRFAPGRRILGNCVVGSDEICDEAVRQRHLDRFTHLLGEAGTAPDGAPIDVVPVADPDVHDNRYYRRSEVDAIRGENLVRNSDFSRGMRGWRNAAPLPLFARPFEEGARCVRVAPTKCGGSCACAGVGVFVQPECRVCEVCVASQAVDVCSSGGEFTLITRTHAVRGDDGYIPAVKMLMFGAACNFVGSLTVRMSSRMLTVADGCVTLTQRIRIPAAVERVQFFACIEIKALRPGGDGEPAVTEDCAIGPDGFEVIAGAYQLRKSVAVEDEAGVSDMCEFRDQVSIVGCDDSGTVTYEPIEGQKTVILEHSPDFNGSVRTCERSSCTEFEPIAEFASEACECVDVCCPPCPPIVPMEPNINLPPVPPDISCFLEMDEQHRVISGTGSMSFGSTPVIGAAPVPVDNPFVATPEGGGASDDGAALGSCACRIVSPAMMDGVTAIRFRYRAYARMRLAVGAVDANGGAVASIMDDFLGPGTDLGDSGTVQLPFPGAPTTGPGTGRPDLPTFDISIVTRLMICIAEKEPLAANPLLTIDDLFGVRAGGDVLIDNFDSYAPSGSPPFVGESFGDKWTCGCALPGIFTHLNPLLGGCSCPLPLGENNAVGLFFPFARTGISLRRVFAPAFNLVAANVNRVQFRALARAASYLVRVMLEDANGNIAFQDVLIPQSPSPCTVDSWTQVTVRIADFACNQDPTCVDPAVFNPCALTRLHLLHLFPVPGLPAICYANIILISTSMGGDVFNVLDGPDTWATLGVPGFPWDLQIFNDVPQCPAILGAAQRAIGEVVGPDDPGYEEPSGFRVPGIVRYLGLRLPGNPCIDRAAFNIVIPLAPFQGALVPPIPGDVTGITVVIRAQDGTTFNSVKASFITGEPDNKLELFVRSGPIQPDQWVALSFAPADFRRPVASPAFVFPSLDRIFVEFRGVRRGAGPFGLRRSILLAGIRIDGPGGAQTWITFDPLPVGPFPAPPSPFPVGALIQSHQNQPVGWKEPHVLIPSVFPIPNRVLIEHDQWEPQADIRVSPKGTILNPNGSIVAVDGWRIGVNVTTANFTAIRNVFMRVSDLRGREIATVPVSGPYATGTNAGAVGFADVGLKTLQLRDGTVAAVGADIATGTVEMLYVSRPLPSVNNEPVVVELLSGVLTDLGLRVDGATACWTRIGSVIGFGGALWDPASPPPLVAPDGTMFAALLQNWPIFGSPPPDLPDVDPLTYIRIVAGGANELFLPAPIVNGTSVKIAEPLGDAIPMNYFSYGDASQKMGFVQEVIVGSPGVMRPVLKVSENRVTTGAREEIVVDPATQQRIDVRVGMSLRYKPDRPTAVEAFITAYATAEGEGWVLSLDASTRDGSVLYTRPIPGSAGEAGMRARISYDPLTPRSEVTVSVTATKNAVPRTFPFVFLIAESSGPFAVPLFEFAAGAAGSVAMLNRGDWPAEVELLDELPAGTVVTADVGHTTGSSGVEHLGASVLAPPGPVSRRLLLTRGPAFENPVDTLSLRFGAVNVEEQILVDASGSQAILPRRAVSAIVQAIAVSTRTLPPAVLGTAYTATISVSGGAGPFGFAIFEGVLPPGLALNAATGVIFGMPTALGSFSFAVSATDSVGSIATRAYSLPVTPVPVQILTSVEIVPASLVIAVNQQQRILAVGRDIVNNVIDGVTVTGFSTSGGVGSINAIGQFSAGSVAVSGLVSATMILNGVTVSGSAAVTVVPSGPSMTLTSVTASTFFPGDTVSLAFASALPGLASVSARFGGVEVNAAVTGPTTASAVVPLLAAGGILVDARVNGTLTQNSVSATVEASGSPTVLTRNVSGFLWRNWTEIRLSARTIHGAAVLVGSLVDSAGRIAKLPPRPVFSGSHTVVSWARADVTEFEDGFTFSGAGVQPGIVRLRIGILPSSDTAGVVFDRLSVMQIPDLGGDPAENVLDAFTYTTLAEFGLAWTSLTPSDDRNFAPGILAVESSGETREDPIVGIFGVGDPDTGARHGAFAFRVPPADGCRNVWIDYAYSDVKTCLGVPIRKRELVFLPDVCGCVPSPLVQDIADFVTDPALRFILPDDGFDGLPDDALEAMFFEYCHPGDRAWRRFGSQSASAFGQVLYGGGGRPDPPTPSGQPFWIKAYLGGGSAGLSAREQKIVTDLFLVAAADALVHVPSGGTSGFAPGMPVWLFNCVWPDNPRREIHCCDCDNQPAGSAVFELVRKPPFPLPGASTKAAGITPDDVFAFSMERDASGFSWTDLLSVRMEIIAPGPINVTVVIVDDAGRQGVTSTAVPASAAPQTIQFGPAFAFDPGFNLTTVQTLRIIVTGIGFSGSTVVFDNIRKVSNAMGNPETTFDDFEGYASTSAMKATWTMEPIRSADVCGAYGTVVEVLPSTNQIRVSFPQPVTGAFRESLKAAIAVSPPGMQGFYWEASPALVDLAAQIPGMDSIFIRWGFRFWQARLAGCTPDPFQPPADFVDNGDGVRRVFDIFGDAQRDVIDPVRWADLACGPINAQGVLADVPVGSNIIRMCAPEIFGPCDSVGIRDTRFPGLPFYAPVCVADRENSLLVMGSTVPSSFPGFVGFDGFRLSGAAKAFRHVALGYRTRTATQLTRSDGTPVPPGMFAGIDYERGRIVLPWGVAADRMRVCFVARRNTIRIPCEPGSYRLVPVDPVGCKGAPSEIVHVRREPMLDCQPHTFYGVAEIDGSPAPFGTQVVAIVRATGRRCGVGVVIDGMGHYFVNLLGWMEEEGCAEQGSLVDFTINGLPTGISFVVDCGAPAQEFNLSLDTVGGGGGPCCDPGNQKQTPLFVQEAFPDAVLGVPYSHTVQVLQGWGCPPFEWSVFDVYDEANNHVVLASIGLSINVSTGEISGTPSGLDKTWNICVQALDSCDPKHGNAQCFPVNFIAML